MSERHNLVNTAVSFIGCKESNGTHKKIIDIYNAHKPLARGYKVKYTDSWCATFVSAMAIKCGLTDIIPTECGCGPMIDLFKKLGAWQENDAYTPKPGDIIFYDWQDNGQGDNTGWSDHVGIVEKVSGKTIQVIEGNKSNAVGRRNLQVNGRYIRGYGVPKFKENAKSAQFKIGDIVNFAGGPHYANANADVKAGTPAAGKAKITAIKQGSKHPFHLVKVSGTTVYGWVDADKVRK